MATTESIQMSPPYVLVASMSHPWMLRAIVASLESLRAPAEMRQELLQCGKTMNVPDLSDDSGQRRDVPQRKVLWLTGQLVNCTHLIGAHKRSTPDVILKMQNLFAEKVGVL